MRQVKSAYWLTLAYAAYLLPASAGQPTTPQEQVANCVKQVHAINPGQGLDYMRTAYQNFDAFYNSSTKMVEMNGFTNGDMQARFYFKKCMSTYGVSLTQ